jgi:hypothetical protein
MKYKTTQKNGALNKKILVTSGNFQCQTQGDMLTIKREKQ